MQPSTAFRIKTDPRGTACFASPLRRKRGGPPSRASLQGPGQSDLRRIHIPAGKNALPCLEGDIYHCPITVQLEKPAAVDGPQKASATGIVEGPLGRATEQSHRIPAQFSGALGPVFRGPQEFFAVVHELSPTVPRDVTGWISILKGRDTIDPFRGNGEGNVPAFSIPTLV